jgi:hypothetical protein
MKPPAIALLNPIIADKKYEGMFDGDPRIAELAESLVTTANSSSTRLRRYRATTWPTSCAGVIDDARELAVVDADFAEREPALASLARAGVLSAAHKWRASVVPPPADDEPTGDEHSHEPPERPATHRSGYIPWARLLRRSLGIDADRCEECGTTMKLRAFLFRAESVERYLRHAGESTEVFPLAPARGPPFFRSAAVRRKVGELDGSDGQVELGFGA